MWRTRGGVEPTFRFFVERILLVDFPGLLLLAIVTALEVQFSWHVCGISWYVCGMQFSWYVTGNVDLNLICFGLVMHKLPTVRRVESRKLFSISLFSVLRPKSAFVIMRAWVFTALITAMDSCAPGLRIHNCHCQCVGYMSY